MVQTHQAKFAARSLCTAPQYTIKELADTAKEPEATREGRYVTKNIKGGTKKLVRLARQVRLNLDCRSVVSGLTYEADHRPQRK